MCQMTVAIVLLPGSKFLVRACPIFFFNDMAATKIYTLFLHDALPIFYYNVVRSFDAATTISGAGNVQWGSGKNTINAAYNISTTTYPIPATTTMNNITGIGAVNVSGGALTLNGVPGIGSANVTGGTLT